VRWILDDGPLDILASLTDLSKLTDYPTGRLFVAPATAESAKRSESRSRLLAVAAPDGQRVFDRFEVFLTTDDPAGAVLWELRMEEQSPANLAEYEAIAWAAVHADDAIFVTGDKRAAAIALAVLGRARVAHPFDLWIDLLEAGAVSVADFEYLCERSRGKDQALRTLPPRVRSRLSTPLSRGGE
jgi:hypothetical protein